MIFMNNTGHFLHQINEGKAIGITPVAFTPNLTRLLPLREGCHPQTQIFRTFLFGENRATYDFGAQKLDEMPLAMEDDRVTFRVLVDRPMYELIGGGGACFKTSGRRDMGKPIGTISLAAEGGALTVESLEAHEMQSAWKK